jgi:penicillin-binding protein 1A
LIPRSAKGRYLLGALALLAILTGGALGAGFTYIYDFPELEYLNNYRPSIITRIYSHDGQIIARLYRERRIPVSFSRIPLQMRQAFLAIEDSRFYKHPGVSYRDILRAFVRNLRARRFVQGGSTITQQLAKVLFLTPERTITRKVREALLALEIERRFTKDEILSFYLNQIYLGSGAYGVEAAARNYFGKSVGGLTLSEIALIAGMPKAPTKFNPRNHPERAIKRRRLVLMRLRELGHITREQELAAAEDPIRLAPLVSNVAPETGYFFERIRRRLLRRYGSALYRSGLQIHTTLDLDLQQVAHAALRDGIKELNRRRGFLPAGKKLKRPPRLGDKFQFHAAEILGDFIYGTIVGYEAELQLPRKVDPRLMREGDLLLGRIIKIDRSRKKMILELQDTVQGAIVALDPWTGAVRALVGGTNYRRYQFNRTLQAKRQPGSAFKPMIMAAALDQGYTPTQILMDSPFVRRMPGTPKDWKPRNYSNRFYGPVTLRRALVKSLNLATIKLLDQIKPESAIKFARRLGLRSRMNPYLSLALGAFEVTPFEFTAGYLPFATGGIYARPYEITRITDGAGRRLEENVPETYRVISAETAYQIRSILRGVVTDGTARKARKLPGFIAGKTGTTNQYRDAWFLGFSSNLILGVWVGRDNNKQMGFRASGGSAALPIWIDVMKGWLAKHKNNRPPPPPPPGITLVKIDERTGLLPSKDCRGKTVTEAFVQGTEPSERCRPKNKRRRLFSGG